MWNTNLNRVGYINEKGKAQQVTRNIKNWSENSKYEHFNAKYILW